MNNIDKTIDDLCNWIQGEMKSRVSSAEIVKTRAEMVKALAELVSARGLNCKLRKHYEGNFPIQRAEPDIQITVQTKDSETADTIMKEFRKSVRRVRRLAGNPLAGKRIRYIVFDEATLASVRILPEDYAMQRKSASRH